MDLVLSILATQPAHRGGVGGPNNVQEQSKAIVKQLNQYKNAEDKSGWLLVIMVAGCVRVPTTALPCRYITYSSLLSFLHFSSSGSRNIMFPVIKFAQPLFKLIFIIFDFLCLCFHHYKGHWIVNTSMYIPKKHRMEYTWENCWQRRYCRWRCYSLMSVFEF